MIVRLMALLSLRKALSAPLNFALGYPSLWRPSISLRAEASEQGVVGDVSDSRIRDGIGGFLS